MITHKVEGNRTKDLIAEALHEIEKEGVEL
jgi:hypothetical protein